MDANDHAIQMPNGREVFKRAVVEMSNACRQLLEKSGFGPDDVDLLIPHQANARIMIAVAERLKIPIDHAVVDVESVGNTSAASIPVALDRAWRAGAGPRGRPDPADVVRRRARVGREPDPLDGTGGPERATPARSRSSPEVRAGSGVRARRRSRGTAGAWRSGTARARPTRRRRSRASRRSGRPASPIAMDVTEEVRVTEAFRRVGDELGPVTGLLNNAGMSRDGLRPRSTRWTSTSGRWRPTCGVPFLCSQSRAARDAPGQVGPDREHVLGRRAPRQRRPDRLRGHEGRSASD